MCATGTNPFRKTCRKNGIIGFFYHFCTIMTRKLVFAAVAALSLSLCASSEAQTASSLFWRRDSLQVKEIVSEQAVQYNFVGHHGPAVENSHCALRVYFNDSGAIDVYSKSGKQMELLKYHWYPTEKQQAEEGAGCDEYLVGKTVGLGGIALWDGEKEVKLVATKGRTARVGDIRHGSFAEIIAYGVQYKGDLVDVSIRVEVKDGSRMAKVIATELNGKKVQFLTGVNFQKDASINYGKGYISIWGIHPADVSQNPSPLGGGMKFKASRFSAPEKTADMVRIISKPTAKSFTYVTAASTTEREINTADKLLEFMQK